MDTDTNPTSWKSDTIKTKHPNNTTNAIKTNAPTSFPSNTSPTKQHASHHPYGIKTTSTGILTRSNSYGKSPTTAHHYSPMSSPLAPIPRRSESKGPESFKAHRLTKSMSSSVDDLTMSTPPPLPFPTRSSRRMSVSSGEDMDPTLDALSPSRARRSQTLPSIPTPPRPSLTSAGVPDLGILRSLDLPDNPKYWTPTNLALYLGTVLSLKHGGPFSDAVVRDVQVHVIREKLSGRTFLRLTEDDLDESVAYTSIGYITAYHNIYLGWASRQAGARIFFTRHNTFANKLFAGTCMDLALVRAPPPSIGTRTPAPSHFPRLPLDHRVASRG